MLYLSTLLSADIETYSISGYFCFGSEEHNSLDLPKSISTYGDMTYLDPKLGDQLKDLNKLTDTLDLLEYVKSKVISSRKINTNNNKKIVFCL